MPTTYRKKALTLERPGTQSSVNEAANEIADSLASTMKDPIKTFRLSSAVSERNSTAQFSSQQAQPGGGPKFSYVDMGTPSNVYVEPEQMPDYDFTKKSSELYNSKVKNWTSTVSSAQDHGKNNYLLGLPGRNDTFGCIQKYLLRTIETGRTPTFWYRRQSLTRTRLRNLAGRLQSRTLCHKRLQKRTRKLH